MPIRQWFLIKYMIKYVAFLRGINVGGNKKVPMEDLRKMLSSLDCTNIKTLLNSGNAIFESAETNTEDLTQKIEEVFVKQFGFESKILLRKMSEIEELIKLDPFKKITIDENVRLYVSFLDKELQSTLKLPYESADKSLLILQKTKREVFSVVFLSPTARTTDAMAFIEKKFGKAITTRNWNTVEKIMLL